VNGYDKSQRLTRNKKSPPPPIPKKKKGDDDDEDESEEGISFSFKEMIMSMHGPKITKAAAYSDYEASDDEDYDYKRHHRDSDIENTERTVHEFYEYLSKQKLEDKKKKSQKKSIFESGITSADGTQVYFLGIIDTYVLCFFY
jgi:hypothetical protein